MNTNITRAVVITRTHPTLNFGQIVEIRPPINQAVVYVLPQGENNIDKNLQLIHKTEVWLCDRAHDYEAYNNAISNARGWPWQN